MKMNSFLRKIVFGLIDIFVLVIGFPIMRVILWIDDIIEEFKAKRRNG